ncbi:MAG: DUF4843 domain-containing protein [Bacteroidaceae bacterium]|nr:DUF4843 domain-containing protein [Bacteroidaceae bacterium]
MNNIVALYNNGGKAVLALLALALLPLFTSCENDAFLFSDKASVRLVGDENWTLGTDSLNVSFQTLPGDEVLIGVDACVIGDVANVDRTVNLRVVDSKTNAPSALYDVPSSVVIPAGKNKGTFYVTLHNSEVLQNSEVRLFIELVKSADFEVGVVEQNHLLLTWNDKVSKPLYWDDIKEFFGEYSETKYRFMLKTLIEHGFSAELNPESGLNWSDLHNYNIIFTNALADYNAAHPGAPLTDENGALVTF